MKFLMPVNNFLLVLVLGGCTGETPKDSTPVLDETVCAEAEARLGYRICLPRIPDEESFMAVTIASTSVDQLRVGKYMVPAVADARLPPVFLDVSRFPMHYDFMATGFPDLFPGLSIEEYQSLFLYPESREFYGGTLSLYIDGDSFFYGFTVWDQPAEAATTVTEAQVQAAWQVLQPRFEIGELAFVPGSNNQIAAVASWGDTTFPIRNPAEVDYEAYTPAVGYGTLRLYSLADFVEASAVAAYGYQDIVVIEEAPEDLTRVVSGIITGTRQGTLSHLNVRSASRGTPNCYIRAPLETLLPWKDQLIRFECGSSNWSAAAASQADAEAFWSDLRPDPVDICSPDYSNFSTPGLLEAQTESAEQRRSNLCAYGSKGSNLATLYQRIDPSLQLSGFLIPFAYYKQFMEEGSWQVDLGSGLEEHSFAETIQVWHEDPVFLTDAGIRSARLEALRTAMMAAPVNPDIVDAVAEKILDTWGNDSTMARVRSSSNAEDSLDFSGAGLYESTSICLADERDGDSTGPSRCDPDKERERPVADGLKEVWASLWGLAPWEERDWYGIDHLEVAMGVLCDDRYNNEQANIVAFSGNPTAKGDWRYLINAQTGDLEVVSAEPGIYPEKVLLTIGAGGVTKIERISSSSEVDQVLSDAQLQELGAAFYDIVQVYPMDYPLPEGGELLWDTEWKFLDDGSLKIKQIRPYLRQ